MRAVLLEIRDGYKRNGDVTLLQNFYLRLRKGSITLLTGGTVPEMNAAADVITGRETLDHGRIRFRGGTLRTESSDHILKNGVAELSDGKRLISNISVTDNFFVCSRMKQPFWVRDRQNQKVLTDLLEEFSVDVRITDPVSEISFTDRCRLQLLKQYFYQVPVVLWDMRRSAVSEEEYGEICPLMRELAGRGMTFLVMDDSMNRQKDTADQIVIVRSGTTVLHAETRDLSPETMEQLLMDTGGRERGADMRPDGKSPDRRDVLFEMNRVSTEYLYDINLFLHKGELVSVECRNHETAESFVSVLRGDAGKCRGELKLSGRTLSAGDTGRRVRDGIVTMDFTVPERYSFSAFTVLEQYMFPRRVKYRGLWRQSRYHAYLKKMIEERKGKGSAGVSMSELYPGDTMRLLLRAWVLARPGVFVCSGLYFGADPDLQEDITRILLEMAAKGTAVMILTQDGGRWAAVADRRYELTEYGTLERVYV